MARFDLIAVYIMASQRNGTLYTGVTTDLLQRGLDHREGRFEGFAKKYGCKTLVWWEQHDDHHAAIKRETQIKGWKRKWKLELIEKDNPQWLDLYDDLLLPRHLRTNPED
ncbi:MAG: GIY-YIG nuclease family protein [Vitreimonas sp.]